MRTTWALILFLLPSLAFAQRVHEARELTGACAEFEVGGSAFAWQDTALEAGGTRVVVRAHEELEVVGLPKTRTRHGEAVRICSGQSLLVRRSGVQGALPLESLALAWAPAGRDDRLLLGRGPSPRTFELRLVDRAGRRIAATALQPGLTSMGDGDDEYTPGLQWLGDMGFAATDGVALARFEYHACGYNNPVIPVIVAGGRMVVGPEADRVSEAGVFHADTQLLFPSAPGGIDQGLVLRTVVETFDESSSTYVADSVESHAWRFDGARFVKQP
ncbi:MAG TPA: hypothetical protein VGK67_04250 [Myxococcales bacterium]|jgi:hypothetical protein